MKNSKILFQEVIEKITLNESRDEIKSIAWILLEKVLAISKTDVMSGKMVDVSAEALDTLQQCLHRINTSEPIQYVLGEAYFYGRRFEVNPAVLIPRPETEELIRTVLLKARQDSAPRILDIATGSGCIALTLLLEFPGADVYASDVSRDALRVAARNATNHGGNINFFQHDILTDNIPVTSMDVIVSNPPYIAWRERDQMRSNVLEFEPHNALFVPDDDPLLFYRHIVNKGRSSLKPGGLLAVEINEKFGDQVVDVFKNGGFSHVQIHPDVAGKPRVVHGLK